jgi:hypothetical protein
MIGRSKAEDPDSIKPTCRQPPMANHLTQLVIIQIDNKRNEIIEEFKEKMTSYANTLKLYIYAT